MVFSLSWQQWLSKEVLLQISPNDRNCERIEAASGNPLAHAMARAIIPRDPLSTPCNENGVQASKRLGGCHIFIPSHFACSATLVIITLMMCCIFVVIFLTAMCVFKYLRWKKTD